MSVVTTVVQAAPAIKAVAPVVAVHHQTFLDSANELAKSVSVVDITLVAGVIATAVQSLINKYKELGTLENYLLGLIGLPGLLAAASVFATSNHFHWTLAPAIAVVGQLVYAIVQDIKNRAKATPSLI